MSVARGAGPALRRGPSRLGIRRELPLAGDRARAPRAGAGHRRAGRLPVVAHVVLARTVFGRYVLPIGGNEEASRLSGVRLPSARPLCTASPGADERRWRPSSSRRGSTPPGHRRMMYELDAIAAAVIGETSLLGRHGTIAGTVIGALIMGVLRNGLNLLGVSAFVQQVDHGRRHRRRCAAGHVAETETLAPSGPAAGDRLRTAARPQPSAISRCRRTLAVRGGEAEAPADAHGNSRTKYLPVRCSLCHRLRIRPYWRTMIATQAVGPRVLVALVAAMATGACTPRTRRQPASDAAPRVAFVMKALNHPFFLDVQAGAEAAAEADSASRSSRRRPSARSTSRNRSRSSRTSCRPESRSLCVTPSGSREIALGHREGQPGRRAGHRRGHAGGSRRRPRR